MFQPLYPKYEPERQYCQESRPESKVARPYIGIVQDLECELDSKICSYDYNESLNGSKLAHIGREVNKPMCGTRQVVDMLDRHLPGPIDHMTFKTKRELRDHTCFVQKCQSFETSWAFFLFMSHQTAIAPPKIPNTATDDTHTSIKHGVKSYLMGLNGPHPSLLPHNGCSRTDEAVKYPVPSFSTWLKLNHELVARMLCDGELSSRMTDN
jgi:hypothetical protein